MRLSGPFEPEALDGLEAIADNLRRTAIKVPIEQRTRGAFIARLYAAALNELVDMARAGWFS